MASDIIKSRSDLDIKNGTAIVSSTVTGRYGVNNNSVLTKPIISDIETKYDTRYDDPSYYYGIGNTNLISG